MIHYHGLPITPPSAAMKVVANGHAFVSHKYPAQLSIALEVASSFAVDNSAYSAWKEGHPIVDWTPYYDWVRSICHYPSFDFAVIPDAVDGSEAENDVLACDWPLPVYMGAPVWHMHESLERLQRLVNGWPRVCIGSSGQYSTIGTPQWSVRMADAMDVICKDGLPVCKIHGLRMLNPKIYTQFPFASADSTNIGRNINLDTRWTGSYSPLTKELRGLVLRDRIEAHQSPIRWERKISKLVETGLFE